MWARAVVCVVALIAAACGSTTPTGVSSSPSTVLSAPAAASSPSVLPSVSAASPANPLSVGAASTTTEQVTGFSWPEVDGRPRWATTPLGLPGTTHVQVTHGPLGFLSLNNVSRGAVVRTSVAGVVWNETAILEGPGGEEQVSVYDMLVTDSEYLLIGEAWTNTATGYESSHNVLWRSPDGATWTSMQLNELVPNAAVARLVAAAPGLVLAGMVHDPEGGTAVPRLWLEQAGGWVELSSAIPGFEERGWIDGAVAAGDGMLLWGNDDNRTFVWSTLDFETWQRGDLGDNTAHIRHIAPVDNGWVAVGSVGTWLSDDAVSWRAGAADEVFATDAISEGSPGFGRLFVQDEYVLAVTQVGYRRAVAWCYEDPSDCGQTVSTVLVTPNGRDWRRLPLPGERPQTDHPVEAHGFLVNGQLAVLHTLGSEAVLSTLESVENAVPLSSGEKPDLAFDVVGPGDRIEPGVKYGYAIYTHCGIPEIGPLNSVYWVGAPESPQDLFDVPGWGGYVLGFIALRADNEIEYTVDGQLIARYLPNPDNEKQFCI